MKTDLTKIRGMFASILQPWMANFEFQQLAPLLIYGLRHHNHPQSNYIHPHSEAKLF